MKDFFSVEDFPFEKLPQMHEGALADLAAYFANQKLKKNSTMVFHKCRETTFACTHQQGTWVALNKQELKYLPKAKKRTHKAKLIQIEEMG